jgi:DNA polymerase, archaea type
MSLASGGYDSSTRGVPRPRSDGAGGVVPDPDDENVTPSVAAGADRRDYDVDHYVRVLRDNFASRLDRAFAPQDFAVVFADPEQPSLFAPALSGIRAILSSSAQARS